MNENTKYRPVPIFELMRRFWQFDMEVGFTHLDVHLYFKLIEINNRLGWEKISFRYANSRLEAEIGTRTKNLIESRQRLIDAGLINYQKGNTRNAGVYALLSSLQSLNPTKESNQESISESNEESNKGNINKTNTKTKQIKRDKKNVFLPPSLSEFKKYFDENGYSQEIAQRAFNGYDVAGWIDSKGNKIKNWKQKCQHVWFKPENLKKQVNGFNKYGLLPGQILIPENENIKQKLIENFK